MGDLKARLNNARVKLLRRSTGTSAPRHSTPPASAGSNGESLDQGAELHLPHRSISIQHPPERSPTSSLNHHDHDEGDSEGRQASLISAKNDDDQHRSSETVADRRTLATESSTSSTKDQQLLLEPTAAAPAAALISISTAESVKDLPAFRIEEPSPDPAVTPEVDRVDQLPQENPPQGHDTAVPSKAQQRSRAVPSRLSATLQRQQSLVASSNARVLDSLLRNERSRPTPGSLSADYFSTGPPSFTVSMLQRKIWVKRPGGSATLVQIKEDDLVDDVRDMILRKYANSLGRSFDAPDLTIRIVSREPTQKGAERILGPEEDMCRTLDAYFPGGQTVDEALLIDVPQKRTPRPSPRAWMPPHALHYDDLRPTENDTNYFPPMPVIAAPSPAALTSVSHDSRNSHPVHDRAMSVLNTGHVPPLPSPGGTRRPHHSRPKYTRTHTSSPTAVTATAASANPARPSRIRHDSSASESIHAAAPAPPPLPTPPATEAPAVKPAVSTPPVPRVSSPRPGKSRKRQKAAAAHDPPSLPAGLLDGSVPPINVLIVEDNIINLRVLGAFMERLKVRWQRAMNGREAVAKWRAGGFHLVLMDIQLPIMNGLEATKEIRRLERVNSIGVFSSSSSDAPDLGPDGTKELEEEDKLGDNLLFKSPVIIVALTASSLQSDRHEALAAGCNDFLTKPVNFVWLERKVKEWGCMQALIDFDGWRKWKDFAAQSDSSKDKTTSSINKGAGALGKKKKEASAVKDASIKDKINPAKNEPEGDGAKNSEGSKEDSSSSTPSNPP